MSCAPGSQSCWGKLRIDNQDVREFLSEMLGTFVLTLFSVASGAQFVLSQGDFSIFLTVNIANGIGVAMAIYCSGGVSGGAVNPAVSLVFCLKGRLPWRRLPWHLIGQILGAFVASALVYGVYEEAINEFDHGDRQVEGSNATAGIFCFFPQAYLTARGGFVDSMVGTGMLILCILALTDPKNVSPGGGSVPLLVGLSVVVIGATLGMNCGYPINPARDLGPRIFISLAGWGSSAFSYRDYNWFWVPLVGPLVGAVVFTLVYWLFVELHHEQDTPTDMDEVVKSPEAPAATSKDVENNFVNNSFVPEPNTNATRF